MRTCLVSFVDSGGLRHSVEVHADSVYEAAATALETFSQHNCSPGLATRLEIEVRSSVTHTISLKKLKDWAEFGGGAPREVILRKKLKKIFARCGT